MGACSWNACTGSYLVYIQPSKTDHSHPCLQEAENKALQERSTGWQAAQQQADSLLSQLTSKDHVLQMLAMDKAYLTNEVALLREKCDSQARDASERDAKVTALKEAKKDLQAKLAEVESSRSMQVGHALGHMSG